MQNFPSSDQRSVQHRILSLSVINCEKPGKLEGQDKYIHWYTLPFISHLQARHSYAELFIYLLKSTCWTFILSFFNYFFEIMSTFQNVQYSLKDAVSMDSSVVHTLFVVLFPELNNGVPNSQQLWISQMLPLKNHSLRFMLNHNNCCACTCQPSITCGRQLRSLMQGLLKLAR